MKHSENSLAIYKKLYYAENETTPEQVHDRVARFIADDEEQYKQFKFMMDEKIFFPNSPTLIHAGCKIKNPWDGQLGACFLPGLSDDMDSIIDLWATAAKIYASGAGIGVAITNLREKGSPISSGGTASGTLGYISVLEEIAQRVRSGGRARRSAALLSFVHNHPEIMDLINLKSEGKFQSFNISCFLTDEFLNAIRNGKDYIVDLISPNGNNKVGEISAKEIWNSIIEQSHRTGDPGILFADTVNRYNPFPSYGPIKQTNPSLARGTKILTLDGIFPIEELEDKIISVLTLDNKYAPAKCILSGKNKELYKITLTSGFEYICTKEHKWPIISEGKINKKETLDLAPGDKIPFGSDLTVNFTFGTLGSYLDGFMIGWNFGDGSITTRSDNGVKQFGFCFNQEDAEQNNCMSMVMTALKNTTNKTYSPGKREREGKPWYEIHLRDAKIAKKFDEFGAIHKSEGLPSSIWKNASEDFRRGFIDALFSTDGNVDEKKQRVTLTSSCKKLIYELSELLGFYGIKTTITTQIRTASFPNGKDYNKEYIRYDLSISKDFCIKFRNLFSLTKIEKQDKLNKIKRQKKYRKERVNYEIKKVEKLDYVDDVWDLQVYDNTHTFKLAHVITGNCGEIPAPEWNMCTLGHINLTKCVTNDKFNFDLLREYAKWGTIFLDNVIDKTTYVHQKFEETMKKTRLIGLGILGWADTLFELGIAYDSDDGRRLFEDICRNLTHSAFSQSIELAKIKGSISIPSDDLHHFRDLLAYYTDNDPNIVSKFNEYGIRNGSVSCIAPTGSCSLIAEASASFEPCFGLTSVKTLAESGEELYFTNPVFEKWLDKNKPIEKHSIIRMVSNNKGSIKGLGFPKEVEKVFVTAHDIKPEDKIKMQGIGQRYITLAISSTCNLPNTATKEDVEKIFLLSHQMGTKGCTIYRDGSHINQPISFGQKECKEQIKSDKYVRPIVRSGKTIEVKSPEGSLYVTINKDDNTGKIIEVFLRMGKKGNKINLLIDALSRCISKGLQSGMKVNEFSTTLRGNKDDSPFYFRLDENQEKPYQAESIVDAIGIILDKFGDDTYIKLTDNEGNLYELCPSCGKFTLSRAMGCRNGQCISPECGYTSCG